MPNIWDIYRHLKFLPTHVFIFSSVIMQFLYMRRTVPKCVDLRVQAQKSGTLIWNLAETMSGAKAQTWCMAVKCIELRVAVFFSKIRIWRTPPPHIESRGLHVEAVWGVETTWKVDILDGAPQWMSTAAGSHCPAFSTDWQPCSSLSCSSLTNFLFVTPPGEHLLCIIWQACFVLQLITEHTLPYFLREGISNSSS